MEPRSIEPIRPCPRLPTTIRSAPMARARSMMAVAGRPRRTAVSTSGPAGRGARRPRVTSCLAPWSAPRSRAGSPRPWPSAGHRPPYSPSPDSTAWATTIPVPHGHATPPTRSTARDAAADPSMATSTRIGAASGSAVMARPGQAGARRSYSIESWDLRSVSTLAQRRGGAIGHWLRWRVPNGPSPGGPWTARVPRPARPSDGPQPSVHAARLGAGRMALAEPPGSGETATR